MGTVCVAGFIRLRMSLGVANVSESMSSEAVPYTCRTCILTMLPTCLLLAEGPARKSGRTRPSLHICAHCASASEGACSTCKRYMAHRSLSNMFKCKAMPRDADGCKARSTHLNDGHAHEPEQAPALLVVLLRHAHRALAVLGHIRLAAGLPASTEQDVLYLTDQPTWAAWECSACRERL